MDRAGNIYGVTTEVEGPGTVFQMKRFNGGWILNTLYTFKGGDDGYVPVGRLVFGPDGGLYGTTYQGGTGSDGGICQHGCGTAYRVVPPTSACKSALCSWNETVLHSFQGGNDGIYPYAGLVFDQAGNAYGDTTSGGSGLNGTVFQLTPQQGQWTETILHNFTGIGQDGVFPGHELIFDSAGNLYGTAGGSSSHDGVVFELAKSGSNWTTSTLYQFQGGTLGAGPIGIVLDRSGNLYGGTNSGGDAGYCCAGTIWELSPSGGGWNFNLQFDLAGNGGPWDNVVMDSSGNLYGTTAGDGAYGYGNVYKVSPALGGGWTYTDLYDFTDATDGSWPGALVLDSNGNLYGAAQQGGMFGGNCLDTGCGTVWEITP